MLESVAVLQKQKHRLIWERRHPEVMEARQKSYDEYLEKKKQGDFDYSFWKYGLTFQCFIHICKLNIGLWFLDKKKLDSVYGMYSQKPKIEGDVPLSKDWQYYKKLSQDPNFDKEQGKKSEIPGFIPPI
jgi:hypothetical protein